jgi:hypothetical protein
MVNNMERKLKPIFNIPPENLLKTNVIEEEMIAKVLELMRNIEERGEMPLNPIIVNRIENEMKIDQHTAHRVFAMAMQRYTPGIKHIRTGEYSWERR